MARASSKSTEQKASKETTAQKSTATKKSVIKSYGPKWKVKFSITLDLHQLCFIPELGIHIRPRDLTLEQLEKCHKLNCSWITQR